MQRIVVSQQGVVASASASRQRQSRSAEACVHPRRSAERQVQDVQLRAPGSTSALSASCSSHRSRRRVGRLHATAGTPTRDPHDVDDGDVPTPGYASIESALKHVSEGKFVVVMDDEDRENEGDLIIAADKVTPEAMAFMIRHTSGVVCVSLEDERCKALQLPPMVQDKENDEKLRTAFCVTCDLKEGITTGISAKERAMTIKALANPASKPEMFNRPGHVFPLRYRKGGVLVRAGHTEAAVDLSRLAGCQPVGVLCEITNEDGSMARQPQLKEFCKTHNLPIVLISDLIRYRRKREELIERTAIARLPTEYGAFQIHSYTSLADGIEHVAMVMGDIGDGESVLARVHSECLTGDIFSSARCDCGPQLNLAMARVAREGRGVIVYLRGQEGRGIGLGHKLKAYNLQDEGRDTVEANVDLGLPIDARDYGVGAQILKDIGVRSLRLMTNNPAKFAALTGHGLQVVGRVPLITPINADNKKYIETKRVKMGHFSGSELVTEQDLGELIPTGPNGEEGPRLASSGAAAQKAGLT